MSKIKYHLEKKNPFLFLISKEERVKTYTYNVGKRYFPLKEVPSRYITKQLCEDYVRLNKNEIRISDIPSKFIDKEFCRLMLKYGVSLKKIPDEFIDFELCKYYLRCGGNVDNIPDTYKTKNMYDMANECSYYNLLRTPKEFLSEEMCVNAYNNGAPIFSIPEDFRTYDMALNAIDVSYHNAYYVPKKFFDENLCRKLILKNPSAINFIPEDKLTIDMVKLEIEAWQTLSKIPNKFKENQEIWDYFVSMTGKIELVPSIYRNDNQYELMVKCNPDLLYKVPFISEEDIIKRTENMCREYYKQKGYINFELFPIRYINLKLLESLYKDATKLRRILDKTLPRDYFLRMKSNEKDEQLEEYFKLLNKLIINLIKDEDYKHTELTKEDMDKVKECESFKILKNCDADYVFSNNYLDESMINKFNQLAIYMDELSNEIEKEDIKPTKKPEVMISDASTDTEIINYAKKLNNSFLNAYNQGMRNWELFQRQLSAVILQIEYLPKLLNDEQKKLFLSQITCYNVRDNDYENINYEVLTNSNIKGIAADFYQDFKLIFRDYTVAMNGKIVYEEKGQVLLTILIKDMKTFYSNLSSEQKEEFNLDVEKYMMNKKFMEVVEIATKNGAISL